MMEMLQGAILGLVQGITEFFPVSSSGHLILFPALLGWEDQGLAFDAILHLGTLTALLWAFRKDLADLWKKTTGKRDTHARSFVFKVILASIPALLIGFFFNDMIEGVFRGPLPVAVDLALWAIVLFAADRFASRTKRPVTDARQISWSQAWIIGFAQILALFPGTSRSGITMTGGLFSGLNREAAVTFSFLLSIPTIAAAGGYGLLKTVQEGVPAGGVMPLLAGFIVAAVSGAWAIRLLRSYVAKHTFTVFVIYRLALAAILFAVFR